MGPKNFAIALLLLLSFSCKQQKGTKPTELPKSEIDAYLTQVMEMHNIPGLALAVIDNNGLVYKNHLGKATLDPPTSVTDSTLFRIFSATKLITATAVFQLIQNQKLDLEDPISAYLDELPLPWQSIKIKHLLSHSSGLPDMIRYKSDLSDAQLLDKLSQDTLEFSAGHQFAYNQTNYWLLGRIIERITGMAFEDYILNNQFNQATSGVLFSSNSKETLPNRAVRYYYNEKTKSFENDINNSGTRGHAGNGLNITLDKFIAWDSQLKNNTLLEERYRSLMWSPFSFSNQKDDFRHGWGNSPINQIDSYGFSGGNLAAYRIFPEHDTSIILLSNGYEIPAYDIIVNDIARMVIPALKSKKPTLESRVMQHILNDRYDLATETFQKLKTENPTFDFENLKWNVNSLGNSYTYAKKLDQALNIFKINAEANPDWWVSWASLAETNQAQKDSIQAISNYQKAIQFNKDNQWGYNDQMQKQIQALEKRNTSE
ncbi:serine hydrolase domain-containing protein [Sediminicola luteus]|nr:serine hydrolase [Sediminicola luteus]